MRTEYLWTKEQRIEKWGNGPWVDEPDVIEWVPPEHDLPCLIFRTPMVGNLNGYAGVPIGHPLHGESADRVHLIAGGLAKEVTFAGPRHGAFHGFGELGAIGDKVGISVPYKDYWFFGFHTAYGDDLTPLSHKFESRRFAGCPYWDFRAVRRQCEVLADCLHRGRVLRAGQGAAVFNPMGVDAMREALQMAAPKTWAEWKKQREKKEGSND